MRWRRVPWPVIAVIATAMTAAATSTGELARKIEYDISDLVTRLLRHEVASDVVIVGIDARSLDELEKWPWPRRYHAQLIDKISEAGPRRLFLDIAFSSRSIASEDDRLVDAFRRWRGPPIVLPAFYQQESAAVDELALTEAMPALLPHATLAFVNLIPSEDGLVREIRRSWRVRESVLPALPVLLDGAVGSPEDELRVDWSIDPSSFDYVSYSDVLANRVPAERFAGKLVFVGATAIELNDMVSVPNYRSVPGVVALAVAYESLRAEPLAALDTAAYAPLRAGPLAAAFWVLPAMWAGFGSFLFSRLSWRRNVAVALGGMVLVAGATLWLYAVPRIVLPVMPFALAAAFAYVLATLRSLDGASFRALAYAVGIRKRDALLKSIVQSSSDAIVCVAGDGGILTANPAAAKLFGCPHALLRQTTLSDYLPELFARGDDSLAALAGTVTETEACSPGGDRFPVDVSISPIRLHDRRLYTAIVRDISERKTQQAQLQFQATHDPLTTLPNRAALAAHLDAALARGSSVSTALMMIDLNRFKEVNDTLGHNVGDYVLYEVARRLAEVVGERGFIARIGGDEFALVVREGNDRRALEELSRVLVGCLEHPVETCGVSIDVGLSLGIARFPDDAPDAETLLKRADIAMYVAKKSRSGFEFYDAANDRHSIRKLSIASRLRKAIANDELELHYQPQVELAINRAESVEALLRWEDAALGRVAPDEFISLAETTDLIQPLTEWTLYGAFRQLRDWRSQGIDLRVAVNLSARVLQDSGFARRLDDLMQRMAVPPDRIELEITESAMMMDPEHALSVVRALDELGLTISIDDFGTGYSSLAYLRDLPVHAVKLDKSFVLNLGASGDDRVIVESTVQMAHALGLEIVAEGVESAAVAEELLRLGYDYAQGYWYSAALRPGALAAWVRQFNAGAADVRSRAGAAVAR